MPVQYAPLGTQFTRVGVRIERTRLLMVINRTYVLRIHRGGGGARSIRTGNRVRTCTVAI